MRECAKQQKEIQRAEIREGMKQADEQLKRIEKNREVCVFDN
jgi:hypothetical protein